MTNTQIQSIGKGNGVSFSKSWQLVGHVSQVEKAGAFFTADVANEPLIVIRGTGWGAPCILQCVSTPCN